jgi:hypothetical protein
VKLNLTDPCTHLYEFINYKYEKIIGDQYLIGFMQWFKIKKIKKEHVEDNDQHNNSFKPGSFQEVGPVKRVNNAENIIQNEGTEEDVEYHKVKLQFFQLMIEAVSIN